MPELPGGTVTLLFTDVEGSTRLVQQLGDRYRGLLATHRSLLRAAVDVHHGVEVDTEGDAMFVAFARATDAVAAAVAAQRSLTSYDWPDGEAMRVRMGLHTGEPTVDGDNYVGYDVHRAARICSSAHGGQVVVSEITRRLAQEVETGYGFVELGAHRLKDLADPESLFQVSASGLPSHFPPLRSVDAVRTNLPDALTSFVGRDRDLEQLEVLVRRHRLVTLTGPGGAGKTRLALRAASVLLHAFSDGVWVIRLGALTDHTRVAQTIADTIGMGHQSTGRSSIDIISDFAVDKHLLLVLDNFEHLIPAAGVVGALVERCPHLSVLVTSRQVLNLRGEREMSVPPMRTPPKGQRLDPVQLAQFESVRLFVDRAQSVLPTFTLSRDNASAVAEVANRLDGLPLAIELAAARVKMLSPTALVARLGNRLDLLTGGSRDLPERQRTLRATMEWSYGLLAENERTLLSRLSVFAAPVRLETVAAVCGSDGDVLPLLAALVDKSLVRRGGGETDDVSFWMLETVKDFGRERLAELGDEERIRRRHAEHHRQLAERFSAEIYGPGQVGWLRRVDDEHDNFETAIQWSMDADEPAIAAAISEGIHVFWWIRGRYATGRYWIRRVLASEPGDPLRRARLLMAKARLAAHQGDFAEADAGLVEAEATGRRLGDDVVLAHALSELLGMRFRHPVEGFRDDVIAAEAEVVFRRRGDLSAQAELLIRRGSLALLRGDAVDADRCMVLALPMMRSAGNVYGQASALNNIGYIGALQGRFDEVLPHLLESRQLFETIGSKEGLANVTDTLALVMLGRDERQEAVSFYEESLQLFKEMNYRPGVACEQVRLGRVLTEIGDHARAATLVGEGLQGAAELGAAEVLADAIEATAALLLRVERPETAAVLFAAATGLRGGDGPSRAPVDARRLDRDLARLASSLDPRVLDAATQRGSALSGEDVLSIAREELAHSHTTAPSYARSRRSAETKGAAWTRAVE